MACGKRMSLIKKLYSSGLSQKEISLETGLAQTTISKLLRAEGVKTRRRGPRNQSGAKNPFWRGGKPVTRFGYRLVRDPAHPRAHSHGYVLEHVKIAEEMIGRRLRPDEVVHHKNGIRTDNRMENLAVMTRREHTRHHALEYWKKQKCGSI